MQDPIRPPCSEQGLPRIGLLSAETTAQIAKALAHPARIRILEQFEGCQPRIAQDIVSHCSLAQSTVSEHLRILREAGVLFARKDGPRTWYCVRRSVLRAFADAVNDIAAEKVLVTS